LAELLPGTSLIDPATISTSDAEWLRSWPRLLKSLRGFMIFGTEDGTIELHLAKNGGVRRLSAPEIVG
jgi:hypothetical protein